ncbi:MAG: glycosyltransferase family 39 protein [Chloroflexi bacterium]|nr:glycosyltransferase family 39 protein [Chloroflexota bacterium]
MQQPADYRDSTISWRVPYRTPELTLGIRKLTQVEYWVGIMITLVLSAIPRVWRLGGTDMWSDEVLTLLRVRTPLSGSVDSVLTVGNQMPFYYLALRLMPNADPFWLRLPSLVLGLLGIVLISQLFSRLYDNRSLGLLMGVMLAVSPMHIILSRTARYYTLLLVLALVASWCFVALIRGRGSRWTWVLLWATCFAAYMTHYTSLVLPAAQFGVLLVTWPNLKRLAWRWAVVQAAAVVPMVLWMMMAVGTYEADSYPYFIQMPSLIDLPISYLNLLTGFEGVGGWYLVPGLAAGAIGLLAGIRVVMRRWKVEPEVVYWGALAISPLVLFLLTHLAGVQYRDRYFLAGMPTVFFFFLRGLDHYSLRVRQLMIGLVLLTSGYLAGHLFWSGEYQRTDWTNVTRFMSEHYQPGDKVLFERQIIRDAFTYYYEGDPTLLEGSELLLHHPAPAAIQQSADRIWVVYRIRHEDLHRQGWERGRSPFQRGLAPISDWLADRRDQILWTVYFDGVYIFLLPGQAG